SRSSRLHAGKRRGGRSFHDAADHCALTQHVVVVLAPLAGQAGSRRPVEDQIVSMSGPVGPNYFERGAATDTAKEPNQNKESQKPGDACAEERQGGEQSKVARLGVHSRSRLERGSD